MRQSRQIYLVARRGRGPPVVSARAGSSGTGRRSPAVRGGGAGVGRQVFEPAGRANSTVRLDYRRQLARIGAVHDDAIRTQVELMEHACTHNCRPIRLPPAPAIRRVAARRCARSARGATASMSPVMDETTGSERKSASGAGSHRLVDTRRSPYPCSWVASRPTVFSRTRSRSDPSWMVGDQRMAGVLIGRCRGDTQTFRGGSGGAGECGGFLDVVPLGDERRTESRSAGATRTPDLTTTENRRRKLWAP